MNLNRSAILDLVKKYGEEKYKAVEFVAGVTAVPVNGKVMSPKELEWLFSLPKELIVKFDNISFFVTHGSLTSANEYLYPNSPIQQLLSNYSNQNFTIFGHTHHSFVHAHGNKYLLNPGSVGQPRDVGNLASYAIVDTSTQSLRFKKISFHVDQIISEATANDPSIPYLKKVLKRGCL